VCFWLCIARAIAAAFAPTNSTARVRFLLVCDIYGALAVESCGAGPKEGPLVVQ
jgi:hypothetical protein